VPGNSTFSSTAGWLGAVDPVWIASLPLAQPSQMLTSGSVYWSSAPVVASRYQEWMSPDLLVIPRPFGPVKRGPETGPYRMIESIVSSDTTSRAALATRSSLVMRASA